MYNIALKSIAASLPRKVVDKTHDHFSRLQKVPIFWHRLWGIKERRYFQDEAGESETDHALNACDKALKAAGLEGRDIDFLICSASSALLSEAAGLPERMMPRLSTVLGKKFGISQGIDIQADCLGFLANLQFAVGLIQSGKAEKVLICVSEHASAAADFVDRVSTIPGDGAAAAVVVKSDVADIGLLGQHFISNPQHYRMAQVHVDKNPGYNSAARKSKFWPIYKLDPYGPAKMSTFVPKGVPAAVKAALKNAGVTAKEIEYFVFHQPSKPIVQKWASALGVRSDRTTMTMERYGVMISASIPVTLATAIEEAKFSGSGLLVLAGAATGWSFGAQVWRVNELVTG